MYSTTAGWPLSSAISWICSVEMPTESAWLTTRKGIPPTSLNSHIGASLTSFVTAAKNGSLRSRQFFSEYLHRIKPLNGCPECGHTHRLDQVLHKSRRAAALH